MNSRFGLRRTRNASLIRRIGVLIMVVLAVSAALFFRARRQSEFIYQGQPVRVWATELNGPERPDRERASRALIEMGPQAVPDLIRMADARDPLYKRPFLVLAPKLPRPLQVSLFRILDPMESHRRRLAAAMALQLLGSHAEAAIPALGKALRDDDLQLSWQAGMALSHLGKPGIAALIGALDPGKPLLFSRVCDLLKTVHSDVAEAVPILLKALEAQSSTIPPQAAKTLAAIGSPSVPGLIGLLGHAEARVRQRAVQALGEIGPIARPAIAALSGRLRDGDASVRAAAAEAIGKIRPWDPQVMAALVPTLKDPNEDVRSATVKALAASPLSVRMAVLQIVNAEAGQSIAALLEEIRKAESSPDNSGNAATVGKPQP